MRTDELVAIIKNHRNNSLGADDGALSNERATAMDHYHGRPYGNEEEGRSAVVSRDLSETIDWAMPAIMRVFTQSGNIAEFDPVGPEDEAQAQQESDYINYVIMRQNNGFLLLHDFIKDALVLKNGYVKHMWEESERVEEESYDGLSLPELTTLVQGVEAEGGTVEIAGQEEKSITVPTPMGDQVIQVFDIKLKIRHKTGKCVVIAVPCEEIRVSKRCRGSLQESPFVEHITRKTRSDLIEMGMDRGFVNSLSALEERINDTEALARDSISDESEILLSSINDKSMDEIEYCEAYIRVDFDGDGIAELRKVVTCNNKIPPGEQWNEVIQAVPITGCVPKRVPHRHVGESLDDELSDLQEIKTTLLRQLLDNIYLTNNNQWLVNERVNLSDFMQSLPGGIKRVRGLEPIADSCQPVMSQPIIGQVLPAIDYVDGMKESRTGINRATTGLDPDILKQSTKGAFMENLNRASQKIEMITRMLAETGIKEMVLQAHGILRRHMDKVAMVKLRGKYVPVNPREWKERTDLTVRVGLGTGNEEEKREKLGMVTQMQDRLNQFGMVGPEQAYQLFADLVKALGFDMPEKYVLNPESPEFKQKMQQQSQQQNPLLMVEQMKLQAEQQHSQAQIQLDQAKAQAQIQQEQLRSANDITIEREKISAQMELERFKAQLKAETDLAIERLRIGMQPQNMMPGAAL